MEARGQRLRAREWEQLLFLASRVSILKTFVVKERPLLATDGNARTSLSHRGRFNFRGYVETEPRVRPPVGARARTT